MSKIDNNFTTKLQLGIKKELKFSDFLFQRLAVDWLESHNAADFLDKSNEFYF